MTPDFDNPNSVLGSCSTKRAMRYHLNLNLSGRLDLQLELLRNVLSDASVL